MSATDCDRFTSLADQQALGEALTDADVRFLREHRDECAFCNAESRAFEALANSLDDARELTQPFALRVQSSLRWRPFAVAALAASVLAGVLGLRALVPAQSPNAGLPSRATLVLSAGSVNVDGAPARLGAKLETGALLDVKSGRVCTGFEPGIRTCLFDMSSARIGVLGEHRLDGRKVQFGDRIVVGDQPGDGIESHQSRPKLRRSSSSFSGPRYCTACQP